MPVQTILILVAVGAAVLLFLRGASRLGSLIALVATGLQAAMAFGLLSLGLKGVPLGLILAASVAGSGVLCWLGAEEKLSITAATVLMVLGAMQVLTSLA